MFVPNSNTAWLRDRWQDCCTGRILNPVDCRLIAIGFVGCNLVMDVADAVLPIVAGGPVPVRGTLATYGQLDGWLLNPATIREVERDDLFTDTALDAIDGTTLPRVQIINRLLVREAIRRRLGQPGAAVKTRADRELNNGVPGGGATPHSCQERLPEVQKAFDEWWDGTARLLASVFQDWGRHRVRHRPELTAEREWGSLLHVLLCDRNHLLVELVQAKGRQWRLCVGERRRDATLIGRLDATFLEQRGDEPYPPSANPSAWFIRMGRRILHASGLPQPVLNFDPVDVVHWRGLVTWARQRGAGDPIHDTIPTSTPDAPTLLEGDALGEAADWFSRIARYLGAVGITNTQPHAEDLFGWTPPTPPPPLFNGWHGGTAIYWH